MPVDDRRSDDVQIDGNEGISGMQGAIPLQRCPHLYIKDTPSKGTVRLVILPPRLATTVITRTFYLNRRRSDIAKDDIETKGASHTLY